MKRLLLVGEGDMLNSLVSTTRCGSAQSNLQSPFVKGQLYKKAAMSPSFLKTQKQHSSIVEVFVSCLHRIPP